MTSDQDRADQAEAHAIGAWLARRGSLGPAATAILQGAVANASRTPPHRDPALGALVSRLGEVLRRAHTTAKPAEENENVAARKKSSAGQKLAAQGIPVILGGSPMRLRVDNLAVIELEARWGSLKALGDELAKGTQGKMFTAVRDILAACIRDIPVDVAELMDLTRLAEYAEAITAAFEEAGLVGGNGQGNPEGPTTAPSPGNASGTSPSSASGFGPASS